MNDNHGTGTFTSEGDNKKYGYTIESWVHIDEYPERRTDIDAADLEHVDFAVIQIWPMDNPNDISYDTLWGPMENWQTIEEYLAYDFGENGSRFAMYQGAAA